MDNARRGAEIHTVKKTAFGNVEKRSNGDMF
jgi:hypothetical protein